MTCSRARCKRRASVHLADSALCRTHAVALADKLVADAVKSRDRRCLSCGATERLQWAHIISRQATYIRWDPENSIALCARCHHRFTLRPGEWAAWVESRWPGRLSELARRQAEGEARGGHVDIAEVIRAYRGRSDAGEADP